MNRYPVERRNIVSGGESVASDVSRDGKRMFNAYKNRQTFSFGSEFVEENPYAPKKFVPEYQEAPEYLNYQNLAQVKENIPKMTSQNDAKKTYAQELLDQISFKNQKKAEEMYEKEQVLALRQWELQQFRDEEERKKDLAKQKTRDYREMLELQSFLKKQVEGERKEVKGNVETVVVENRFSSGGSNRRNMYNPITGEPYENAEALKGNDRSLASYGNLVVQARRPY